MLTKQQEKDSKKCDEMQERDRDMDCLSCSCNVCIAQESVFDIEELVKQAHANAVEHGFWDEWKKLKEAEYAAEADWSYEESIEIGNRLMLITDEVSEAHEALRKKDEENFKEELADIVIRVADLAGGLSIDLEAEIKKKMEKNLARPYKHGKAF